MYIELGDQQEAFAAGGNRLCFIHPTDRARCIKVLRPERSPTIRRRNKGFPKNLKPLHSFDENFDEYRVMQIIDRTIGAQAYQLLPQCYGFVETNYGPGLVSELIIDSDQKISISLKQYIWEQGVTDQLAAALTAFSTQWMQLGMPSRDLLLHNILVQQSGQDIKRLVVIDGLGWTGLSLLAYLFKPLARRKASRKIASFYQAIDALLSRKENQKDFGYHGWLQESKRNIRL